MSITAHSHPTAAPSGSRTCVILLLSTAHVPCWLVTDGEARGHSSSWWQILGAETVNQGEDTNTALLLHTHGWLMSGSSFLMEHRAWSLSKHVMLCTRWIPTDYLMNKSPWASTAGMAQETETWRHWHLFEHLHSPFLTDTAPGSGWGALGWSLLLRMGFPVCCRPSPLPPISICYGPQSHGPPGVWEVFWLPRHLLQRTRQDIGWLPLPTPRHLPKECVRRGTVSH